MKALDLADHAGLSYRQLDYAIRKGLIHPHPCKGRLCTGHDTGTGYQRWFTRDECAVVCHMGALVRAGMTPTQAAPLARQLHEHGHARVAAGLMLSRVEEGE